VSSTPAVHGLAAAVDTELSTTAPANAPIAPLTPALRTVRQWTLPKRQCAAPEASVVPISARCTDADAVAGAMPAVSSKVVEVAPYAMPSAPSISWAASPTNRSTMRVCILSPLLCPFRSTLPVDLSGRSYGDTAGSRRGGPVVARLNSGNGEYW
jgi:hypothetical protein